MGRLRDTQQQIVDESRELLKKNDRIVIQSPTGSGKSIIISEIIKLSVANGNRCWVCVPRLELLAQQSAHLTKWGVSHNTISATSKESNAFMVHVVSRDTIIRRLDKIKNKPRLLIIDEAHLGLDIQKRIIEAIENDGYKVKVCGFTATPELLSGRGLTEVYQGIVYGASIPYLTECGFLSPLRYFAPPLSGSEDLHWSKGEADATELEKLLAEHNVYGDCIKYYRKYGKGRRALGFCRSVDASEKTAAEFRAAGFKAESIDGKMTVKKRKMLIDALADKKIDVLTSCMITAYGLDLPAVDYLFMLRPTLSKALYFQMVGRGMRFSPGKNDCIVFDHVDNVKNFQDPRYPGVPLFYIPDLTWNFEGTDKRRVNKKEIPEIRLCPNDGYAVCMKACPCRECELYVPRGENEPELIESIPLSERNKEPEQYIITDAEKQEYQDAVIKYVEIARTAADEDGLDKAIRKMLELAEKLGNKPMWVYHIVNKQKHVIDVRILYSMCRVKGWKIGYAWVMKNQLKQGKAIEEAV
ncbi:hypothetical protein FACS1894110_10130 [Spirochaetia bacterium]|nr:hypothetical protein FACS1894110_10130 [Spirochaetia bacterium]